MTKTKRDLELPEYRFRLLHVFSETTGRLPQEVIEWAPITRRHGSLEAKQQVNVLRRDTCGDCGAKEGQLHRLGCDMERCLSCGGQLISCDCSTDWDRLRDSDRVPFITYPNVCAKCGTLWPEMFRVPDAEWKHYIEPSMRREILCESCYKQIKAWIDAEGRMKRKERDKNIRWLKSRLQSDTDPWIARELRRLRGGDTKGSDT
jgi:hypothetical protein